VNVDDIQLSIRELNDIVNQWLRKLDTTVWPREATPSRNYVFEHLENLKHEMMRVAARKQKPVLPVESDSKAQINEMKERIARRGLGMRDE
jgi:hypothetical protein